MMRAKIKKHRGIYGLAKNQKKHNQSAMLKYSTQRQDECLWQKLIFHPLHGRTYTCFKKKKEGRNVCEF
jgi:hypothetical protein